MASYWRKANKRYMCRLAKEGEVNSYGKPLRADIDYVIVRTDDCPIVYTEFEIDYNPDRTIAHIYPDAVKRHIVDPSMVEKFVPTVSTDSCGGEGYFCPRKGRKNGPSERVWIYEENEHGERERKQIWTNDYYTLTSYMIRDGYVYTHTDYIHGDRARKNLLPKFGKSK